MIIINMAKLVAKLDQVKVDIVELKNKNQIAFLILDVEESEEDGILELRNNPLKNMGKRPQDKLKDPKKTKNQRNKRGKKR